MNFPWNTVVVVGLFLCAAVGFKALGDAELSYVLASFAGGIVGLKALGAGFVSIRKKEGG